MKHFYKTRLLVQKWSRQCQGWWPHVTIDIALSPSTQNQWRYFLHQAHEGLLTSYFGEEVKQRYLVFAQAVDAFNIRLYTEWEQRVGAVATEKLKQPILFALTPSGGKDVLELESLPYAPPNLASQRHTTLKVRATAAATNTRSRTRTRIAARGVAPDSKVTTIPPASFCRPYRYGVNFAAELQMIIRESKYLDRMGFQVERTRAISFSLLLKDYSSYT